MDLLGAVSLRWVSRLLVLLIVVAIIASAYELYCEYLAAKNLRVEIAGVSIVRVGLASADLDIKLKFTNPTTHETPVFWVDSYQVYINNIYVGSGSLPLMKVPANTVIYCSTTLTVEYEKAGLAVLQAIKQGSFEVKVEGVVKAKILSNLITISTPFTTTRTVALS